jgi:hypothetical protein
LKERVTGAQGRDRGSGESREGAPKADHTAQLAGAARRMLSTLTSHIPLRTHAYAQSNTLCLIAEFSKSNKKLFFDRIQNEVLDFQELCYRVELMGSSSFADSLQKRFDQSMDQFELVVQDTEN